MSDEFGPWIAGDGLDNLSPDAIVRVVILHPSEAQPYMFPPMPAREFSERTRDNIIAYRVKREPKVETVRRPAHWWRDQIGPRLNEGHGIMGPNHRGYFVFETCDGIPDMTTLRWEDAT